MDITQPATTSITSEAALSILQDLQNQHLMQASALQIPINLLISQINQPV